MIQKGEPDIEPDIDPLLQGMNPVQREAVLFGDGPLLVLAGAGSGKTRVLTRRIAHLILRREIAPDRILAVTFTNKAAEEMRSRVGALLGYDASGLWVGTFHSICLRWIRRHSDRLGLPGHLTVFDADDQNSLLKEILRSRGDEEESFKVRELRSIISLAKNKMWDPGDLEAGLARPDRARLAAIFREYQERLRRQGGVDFDDLLVLAVHLMEDFPEVGEAYARKFQHVLVDEYQDTNHVQFRLVRRLSQGHGNVMAVGDDDQSIYGWRGADVGNILDFEAGFPEAKVLRMTQNYRSTGAICELANAVIRHNKKRKEKALWTENPAGDRPSLFVAPDEEAEARHVLSRLSDSARRGESGYDRAVILYRMHAQSRPFEEHCLRLGIPYVILGGVLFYQRREVKDLLAYLKLAVNPRDEVSFARALAFPSRGVGKVSLDRIFSAAAGGDLVSACAALPADSGLRSTALEKVRNFGALMQELSSRLNEGAAAFLQMVCDRTGFVEALRGSGERDADERVANVQELVRGAGFFEESHGEGGLTAYLDQVALYTSLDTKEWQGERVTLMTVHNAKGLEYDRVFLTGLEEGVFPHASAFDDPAEMEEERRLFYVAATRARLWLELSASLDRRRGGRVGGLGVSRFLDEIPPDLLERCGSSFSAHSVFAVRRPSSWARERERSARAPEDDVEPDPYDADGAPARKEAAPAEARVSWRGREIVHAIFGVGRVETQDGEGPGARLSIVFPQVGRKKILARFVRPLV